MAKKEDILKKNEPTEYELSTEEKTQVASLMNLITQARMAQDFLYSGIVSGIADRYEIADKGITLNMQEIENNGIDAARLIVTD
jgi:hypothetical protein